MEENNVGDTRTTNNSGPDFAPKMEADKQLVQRALRGDNTAIEKIVELHYQDILYFATKKVGPQEGEDIAQRTIITILKKLDTLKDPNKFKSWMMTMVYNECIDHLRRKTKDNQYLITNEEANEEALHQIEDDDRDFLPEEALINEETRVQVLEVLTTLPSNYADCIRLRYEAGLSRQEIAEVLDVKEKKVQNDLHRGLKLFKERIEQKTPTLARSFSVAPAAGMPILTQLLASEKADVASSDAALRVLTAAKEQVAIFCGAAAATGVGAGVGASSSATTITGSATATTATTATTTTATTAAATTAGLSGAKIGVIAIVTAAAVLGGSYLATNNFQTQTPQPQPDAQVVVADPIEEEPELLPINSIADMVGTEKATQLANYEAQGTTTTIWQAFLQDIGAQEELIANEADYTYTMHSLQKQDKQLVLIARTDMADSVQVISQFGLISPLPHITEVIFMF